jgi:hypothetical protein
VVTHSHGSATQRIVQRNQRVGDTQGGAQIALTTFTNVNLASVAAREEALVISNDGKENLISRLRNSPHTARLYFDGSTKKTPVDFKVKVKFDVIVTYKVGVLN